MRVWQVRRVLLGLLAAGLLAAGMAARASGPPVPEPNFAGTLAPSACLPTNSYESDPVYGYHADSWYGAACQRLHFTYGPLTIKPGQNDVIVSPITIEKPAYDGYVTRFRPDLVRADGSVPPIEQIHLHHAVWLSVTGEGYSGSGTLGPVDPRDYGEGPFFASGEEKTIFRGPQGYGMPVKGTDSWQLLYMVHNLRNTPDTVWITYDVDYVAKAAGDAAGIKPMYPIWLDVRNGTAYPVFNVQRGYPAPGSTSCTWPNQECAAFDSMGRSGALVGQGTAGNNVGRGWTFPGLGQPLGRITAFHGGTLIGIGGHLHPGGLTDNIDLQRGSGRTRIFTSEAKYWDWDPSKNTIADGPPTSWDLSMTTTWMPRWGVRIQPNDTLWISATYDTTIQSTYEDMGIAVAWLAPDDTSGVDVFAPGATTVDTDGCTSDFATQVLCTKGTPSHGHMTEADNKGGTNVKPVTGTLGPAVSRVEIAGFNYLSQSSGSGIPTVKNGSTLTFDNEDAASDIYHSITSCKYPCTGDTGIAYPLADGAGSDLKPLDFDSSELGYGPNFGGQLALGPAKNQISWSLPIDAAHGFAPGTIYTFFCRVHPVMRGNFEVIL
ncbi:MAG: hypothetical protein E6G17_04975 [Actinobacteria bacterium]|nr:MAG: hypothetical protein E6G17_04975 [Actinomycetota bacterium]